MGTISQYQQAKNESEFMMDASRQDADLFYDVKCYCSLALYRYSVHETVLNTFNIFTPRANGQALNIGIFV
ncbi:hypothetical protein OPV22_012046 [Ensete ventricosum]|uniref:Uncharacterized protein n=1 Tax=Ensete ventricosum TaxID=4639 RepID=A0AAV8R292_ENSVE|nr:hypothetical protein OPV22_012046 [Ensete ventricosum]